MVVFWKENLGRQLRLITPENEERDGLLSSSLKFPIIIGASPRVRLLMTVTM